MPEESVFQLLERVFRARIEMNENGLYVTAQHDSLCNYVETRDDGSTEEPPQHVVMLLGEMHADLLPFLANGEPLDNLVERIQLEFHDRDYEVSDDERELSTLYLEHDFVRAKFYACQAYEAAVEITPDRHAWNFLLNRADFYAARAWKDVQLIHLINPDMESFSGEEFEKVFDGIEELADRIAITRQCPLTYRALIPLHFKLKDALACEDYENAAVLRDEIRGIVPNYNGNFRSPGTLFLRD